MPHLGKIYPRQFKHYFQLTDAVYAFGPVRKIVQRSNALIDIGWVANLWHGTKVVSEEADWLPDGTGVFYRVINPTDSQATVDWEFRYEANPFTPSAGDEQIYRVTVKPFYAGVQLADKELYTLYRWAWLGEFGEVHTVGPVWLHKTDPAAWTQAILQYWAANWDDQPEYQPYRTNPF